MKLTIKAFFLTAILVLFAIGVVAPKFASAADTRIAIVDLQKAMNDSKKGQKAKTDLNSKGEGYQKKIKAREAQLEQMKRDVEKQGSALSREALATKEKEYKNLLRVYEDEVKEAQDQMQKSEMELLQPIINGLIQAAGGYAKESGFTLLLEMKNGGVLWAADGVDITAEVIKRFDAGK